MTVASTQPPKSKPTDWAALLQEAVRDREIRPPEGFHWMTARDLVIKFKVGKCRLHRTLRKLIDLGRMVRFDGMVMKNGKLSKQCFYRIVT